MTNIPAGWYADPENASVRRWWDGAAWTDHRSEPYSPAASADLKAPEGTQVNTVWIWLIVLLPLLPLVGLLLIDWPSMMYASMMSTGDPTGLSAYTMFADPAYLSATLSGWLIYGLCAWFAYLDWRELARRGVPRPFHFAWVFLSSLVYVIGRSVVVRRRTGHGTAPMWVAIATIAVSIAVAIYVIVVMVSALIDVMSQLGFGA